MHALIVDGQIVRTGGLPDVATRLADGLEVRGLRSAGVEHRHACGWYEVAETDPPAHDPDTQTVTSTVELVAGVPTRTWQVVALDAAALTDKAREATRATIAAKAEHALTANATFLALASPTTAQAVAQVRTLTRECNALIRLLLSTVIDGDRALLDVDDA